LQRENENLKTVNGQLMKGINNWNNFSFPITRSFEIASEFGMYLSFGDDEISSSEIEFPEVIKINDKNEYLKTYVFRNNNLYAFMLNEFSRYNWDQTYTDDEPPLNSIKNPGKAAEIFDQVAGFHVGYFKEEDHIALTHLYREVGFLVGIIIPTENLITKFDKPLTINASQGFFGRPTYYIVESNSGKREIVLTVYRLDKGHFLMIFYDGILQGICRI
jgi:hypothetical protein